MTTLTRLRWDITIEAPAERVWDVMLEPETYARWTAAFMEGSTYEGEWRTGSRIAFLAPTADGGSEGMLARIVEADRPRVVTIEHLGMVRDGVEDTTSDEVRGWAGAIEQYVYTETDGATELHVEMDTTENEREMFERTWPEALAQLKHLVEAN